MTEHLSAEEVAAVEAAAGPKPDGRSDAYHNWVVNKRAIARAVMLLRDYGIQVNLTLQEKTP